MKVILTLDGLFFFKFQCELVREDDRRSQLADFISEQHAAAAGDFVILSLLSALSDTHTTDSVNLLAI